LCRVGQNHINSPYMTVYLVISLPKIPYIHRKYMVLANPRLVCCVLTNKRRRRTQTHAFIHKTHAYIHKTQIASSLHHSEAPQRSRHQRQGHSRKAANKVPRTNLASSLHRPTSHQRSKHLQQAHLQAHARRAPQPSVRRPAATIVSERMNIVRSTADCFERRYIGLHDPE